MKVKNQMNSLCCVRTQSMDKASTRGVGIRPIESRNLKCCYRV